MSNNPNVLSNDLVYALNQIVISPGSLGIGIVKDEGKIRFVITGAGASNVIQVRGRINNQTTWNTLAEFIGNVNELVEVFSYDEVEVLCTVFEAANGYDFKIVASSFDSNKLTIDTPNGTLDNFNTLTFDSSDDTIEITADPLTGTIDFTTGAGAGVSSVNGRTGDVILDKADVNLDQVDNTSDINKPISTATQTALDLITDVNWTGDYNNGTTYTVGDGVMFNGASFRMIAAIGAAGYDPATYPANWLQVTDYVSANDVGLGNVDNTSDADKPISDLTQDALDEKVAKAGDIMSGTLTVSVPAVGITNLGWQGISSQSADSNQNSFYTLDGAGVQALDPGVSNLETTIYPDYVTLANNDLVGGTTTSIVMQSGQISLQVNTGIATVPTTPTLPEHVTTKEYVDAQDALKEDVANKSIDGTLASNSDTLYPSQKAVKTYADALDDRIVPIEDRAEVLTVYAYENNAQVYADGQPGVRDTSALIRDGWYFKNSVAGQKINWYYFDGTSQGNVTLGDLKSSYAVMTFDAVSGASSPIIAIYTFPTGTGDVIPGFAHSRIVYDGPMTPIPVVGKQYLVYAGENPPVHPQLPRINLALIPGLSIGDKLPTEQILTISLGSSSGAAVNQIQYMVETLGLFSDPVKHEMDLRIRTVPLNSSSKIDATYLPSYVDDVLEYANLAEFPVTGSTGIIYVALDTNKIYRWSGSAYIEISPSTAPTWGSITGLLSNQTDLQNALDGKANTSHTQALSTLTQSGAITGEVPVWNGTAWIPGVPAGTAVWGGITGALSSQTDLKNILDAKFDDPTGTASQYIRGDGVLANFPSSSGGGGASVSYYLNGGTASDVSTYYQMSKTPVVGLNADFTANTGTTVLIAQFMTDVGDPSFLNIPPGNWNFEMFFNASSAGGSPTFYVELYKYNGTSTLIASGSASPESITNGTDIDLYVTALAVPDTSLLVTDRLEVRVYVTRDGKDITLHTQDSHLCQVITTFGTGLAALNGLTKQVQYLAVGTTGNDFNIDSSIDTHTFNLPTASSSSRGALSSTDWSTFNSKASALSTDISPSSFLLNNNETSPSNVSGLVFPDITVRGFKAIVSVSIRATTNLYEMFELVGINKDGVFDMSITSDGDNSGVVFSITSTGQVQYTSANYSGFVDGTIKFRAITTSI